MLTDNDIIAIAQAVERLLLQYDIHLNEGRFNALCDTMADLVVAIEENGQ